MIFKVPFLKQFNAKTSAEQGRSMVEILGVLAVIGVLSAGGIYGYSFAMDKYRANDIVYEVNLRANDIWHKYQEMPLPEPSEDGTDFDEFPDTTGTGYPIYMTSHPDVAFKTYVEGVSSRVCKNVVNMNLNGVIQGIQFVQVNGEKYVGSSSICGEDETDNTIVFTSFLDTENNGAGEGQSGDPCVEDADCTSLCGTATCDIDKLVCTNNCTGTDTPHCLDDGEGGQCVECLVNDDCKSQGRNYICNEATHECSALQNTCPDGTFRSQNGACILCDNGNNFFVLKDGKGFPDTSDEVDGYTMCGECESAGSKRWYGEITDDSSRGYCSFMCTEGYSYQSLADGCISCDVVEPYKISNESISKAQCLACSSSHHWYSINGVESYCQKDFQCTSDEWIMTPFGGGFRKCVKCSDKRNGYEYIGGTSSIQDFDNVTMRACNSCPEKDSSGNYSARYVAQGTYGKGCFAKCEQPESGSEADTICKTNPKSDKCKRQWQNSSGKCFPCDALVEANGKNINNEILTNEPVRIELCEACGRVVEGNFCILKQTKDDCGLGKFLGEDGFCYECDIKKAARLISSDELSGCTQNCRKNADGEYDINGSIATRETYEHPNGLICKPICETNYIYPYGSVNGTCEACGNSQSTNAFRLDWGNPVPDKVKDECRKCDNRDVYEAHGTHCSPSPCPTGYFKNRLGTCVSCDRANNGDDDGQYGTDGLVKGVEICHACGNRIARPFYGASTQNSSLACVLANPGVSGICNSVPKLTLPEGLKSDIVQRAQAYLNGSKDGEKFTDSNNYCRSCSDEATYQAYQEQCAMCRNRRWEGKTGGLGSCSLGLCEEGKQFLNTNATCVACTNKNVAVHPDVTNLCSSCDNRRVLTTGFKEQNNQTGLCVEECVGDLFQKTNGECIACSTNGTFEIGTDAESIRLCNDCENRTAVPIMAEDVIVSYQCVVE